MRQCFGGLKRVIAGSALATAAVAAQVAATLTLLLPLAACGGSPMSVESRYVEPTPAQPTIEQRLALERQKARRGHY